MRGIAQEKIQAGQAAVRAVKPCDAPLVAEMMTDYFYEAQPSVPLQCRDKFVLDPEYVARWAKRVCSKPQIFGFVDDDGMIFGEIVESWIGPNKIVNGGIWYVRPRARGGLLAWRLLKAFDEKARQEGLLSRIDLDNPVYHYVIGRMYKKMGFKEYSKIYVKEYYA